MRALQADTYTEAQREGALGTVFSVDHQLIADGTYFVVETDGAIAGCGGWSIRRKAHGADEGVELLDPAVDAAHIRAFFVDPDWARRGLGAMILRACEEAAAAAGFKRLTLVATLAGERLYSRYGFVVEARYDVILPSGEPLPVVAMGKAAQP